MFLASSHVGVAWLYVFLVQQISVDAARTLDGEQAEREDTLCTPKLLNVIGVPQGGKTFLKSGVIRQGLKPFIKCAQGKHLYLIHQLVIDEPPSTTYEVYRALTIKDGWTKCKQCYKEDACKCLYPYEFRLFNQNKESLYHAINAARR
eukprot:TRINITY_DN1800_c0_g1_i2.p1 TRINITY_DN1800_c0_g1~~TRINITY_DN1800_c0_g1_i2.p1  ORF type:complete len:148 (-),score=19.06 TRINITY_DN1800_c0_g1_i2:106-549(-)